jgi:uncharacterized membrane protein YqiK
MLTPTPQPQSLTRRQSFFLLVGIIVCILLAIGAIFFVIRAQRQKRELILQNPGYAVGTITRRRTRKNRSITVTYRVGGQEYRCRGRVTRLFLSNYKVGDTTTVVYAKADPSKAILKVSLQRSKY